MRVHRFYLENTQDIDKQGVIETQSEFFIQHLKALRIKISEKLIIFNGSGIDYLVSLEQLNKKSAKIKILKSISNVTESPLNTHLGQVIARGEKMDWIIQKATELGVNEITPLFSKFCNVKLTQDRLDKKIKHWEKIAISAAEQCGRSSVPKINTPCDVKNWCEAQKQNNNLCLTLSPNLNSKLSNDTKLTENKSISFLIGPEGGLSEDEIICSEKNQFKGVNLGPRILRTETASIVCLSLLQSLWGDV